MALELMPYDVLDQMKTDEDLAFLLNDALDSGDHGYLEDTVANLERARGLPSDPTLDVAGRLYRAAHAIGMRVVAVPAETKAA